jgi:cytochrome c-type biogenesis protein CcsB
MGPVEARASDLLRWAGLVAAAAAGALYARLWVSEAVADSRLRRALLWFAVACMTLFLAWRSATLGTVPLLSPTEALYFYAWLVFLVYLVLMRSPTQASVGALLVPFGAACALAGAWSASEATVLPIFRTPLFALHTLAAFLGYSALSVACCAGILYLVLHDQVTKKKLGRLFHRLPPLEDLDELGHRTVWLGFFLLTIAIVAGAVWARREWGVHWIWEPKAVWAASSWLVYAGYLVARWRAGWRGERAAWLATIGFAVSIASFLGTNYLLASGRHTF